jgi:hypothetical protein
MHSCSFAPTPVGAARIGNAGVGILEGPGTVAASAGLAKAMAPPATNVSNPATFGILQSQQSAENAGNRTGRAGDDPNSSVDKPELAMLVFL